MELHEARDRRLARRAAAGDDSAFAELVGRHRGALVAFVAHRTGRATIAEDAVQEALLSAHRALRGSDPPRDVKAWLYTIAWRRAIDLLRREGPAAGASSWEDVRTVEALDVLVGDAAEFEAMLRHWRRLPHRQRHALAMSVLEGRSLEEIGSRFGVSPEAAKSLVARSRRSLAAAMDRPRPARRRDRVALLFPAALVERVRDGATFVMHNEQPVSLATKVCAGACAAALAGGGGTAAVVGGVAPVKPLVSAAVERTEKPKKERRERKRAKRPAQPTPTATAAPVFTPAPQATRQATPSTDATTGGTTRKKRRRASGIVRPMHRGTSDGHTQAAVPSAQLHSPKATPTPAATPGETATE